MGKFIDIKGKRFGIITVQEYVGNSHWKCECDCGKLFVADGYRLRNGQKSCGCLKKRNQNGNSYAESNSKYLDEWDYEKNEINPSDVSVKSGLMAWWKCKHGHSWKASIYNRETQHSGCPYCSGRYAISGENDLATLCPEIAAEWNYDRNDITPDQIKPMSNKSVWWKCKHGHEWKAPVCSRVGSGGHECPHCASAKRYSFQEYAIYYYIKQIDESVVHADNSNGFELDIYIPTKRVAIEYDGYYWHKDNTSRDKKKNKKCLASGIELFRLREYPLENLNDSSIDIICKDDFDEQLANIIYALYHKKINIDTERDATLIKELQNNIPKNNIADMRPDMAREFDVKKNGGLKPNNISVYSNLKYWWKCPKGHSYQMKADDRAKAKQCPYCSGRRGRKVRNIETGEVFETQKDAALSGNTWPSSIYKCCKGLLNTAGGYHWEYVYEEMGE